MIRATLKGCIDLFNSNITMQFVAIRGMEQLSEWRVAAEYWNKLNRKSDADTCLMIAEAIEKGDRYRDATKHLIDWVDDTVQKDIMSENEAIAKIYPELSEIYKEHYN